MGKPSTGNAVLLASEYIASHREPREVKHLSTWWKRKQVSTSLTIYLRMNCKRKVNIILLVAASERGTAQTHFMKVCLKYVFGCMEDALKGKSRCVMGVVG